MKNNIIKGILGVILLICFSFALTGCGNEKNEVKQYAKETNDKLSEIISNVTDENNSKNQINEENKENIPENKENTIVNNTNTSNNKTNTNTTTNNNTVKNNYSNYIGVYKTTVETSEYINDVSILIQNCTNDFIDFAINAAAGNIARGNIHTGLVNGRATRKSDMTYVFSEKIDGLGTSTITFTFKTNNSIVIDEKYPNDVNPYAGHGLSFKGTHNKTNKSVNIMDSYSNIYLTVNNVKNSDFSCLWENSKDGIELAIYNDGTFCLNHHNGASEVRGTYTIEGTKIYLKGNDKKNILGEMLMQQAGNNTLKIDYEGREIYLYNEDGD